MSENKSRTGFAVKAKRFFSGIGLILLILIALFVLFSVTSDSFMTSTGMYNLARATAINGICALGMTCAIIVGGIDLSIGSVAGLSSVIIAYMTSTQFWDTPILASEMWWVAALIAIAMGAANGLLIGWLVNDGNLPPFIASVGMQIVLRSATQLLCRASNLGYISQAYKDFFSKDSDILGIPLMAIVWVVIIIITYIILRHTRFGRNIYAVGSNAETARLNGISLRRTRCGTWMYSGILAAIAGILLGVRIGSGNPTAGKGFETDAIAASVIGGASMSGGEGSVLGTVIGSIIIQTIRNGGNALAWNSFLLEIIVGVLIIACVLLDTINKKNS